MTPLEDVAALDREADEAVVRSVWGMKPAAVASAQSVADWTRTAAQFVRNRVASAKAEAEAEAAALRSRLEVAERLAEALQQAAYSASSARVGEFGFFRAHMVNVTVEQVAQWHDLLSAWKDATESKPGEPPPARAACPHTSVYMGSGGYYIFCHGCDSCWLRIRLGSDESAIADYAGGCNATGDRNAPSAAHAETGKGET